MIEFILERLNNMSEKRIALIIPHTDITLETDLQRNLPDDYIIHTQRIWLDDVSEDSEKKMVDIELPKGIKYLENITEYEAAIFGCTSASAVYGKEGLERINKLLEIKLNCSSTSAFKSIIEYIRKYDYKKIALLSPYTEEVNGLMAESLKEYDIEVTYMNGLGLSEDRDISKVDLNEILEFVEANKKEIQANADCCFISCTNFRSTEIIDEISKLLDMRVLTSNYSILKFILD